MRHALALLVSVLFASPALAGPVEAEVDLLELHVGDGDEHFTFDSAVSVGSDTDRFEVRASGGSDVGPLIDNVQLEALYVRNVSDKVTLLAGIRQDVRGGEDLTHGSLAFVVTPVDWLEVEHFFCLKPHSDDRRVFIQAVNLGDEAFEMIARRCLQDCQPGQIVTLYVCYDLRTGVPVEPADKIVERHRDRFGKVMLKDESVPLLREIQLYQFETVGFGRI